MDLQTWREKANATIRESVTTLKTLTPGVTYGYMATCTLLPLIAESSGGNLMGAVIALSNIMAGVGGNLIASRIQSWHEQDPEQIAADVTDLMRDDPEWLAAINELMDKLETQRVVQAILPESDWDRLQRMLQDELAALEQHIDLQVTGDNPQLHIQSAQNVYIKSAIFQALPEPGQVAPQELLRTYLQQLVHDTSRLDLSGVDHKAVSDQDETHLELAAIYTALDTVQSKITEDADFGGRGSEGGEMERRSALSFASQTQYAALLGDPGSGKTTFTNFLVLCLAGEILGLSRANLARLGEEWDEGSLLPVRVVLRHFATTLSRDKADHSNPLWDYIIHQMGSGLEQFGPLLNRHLLEHGGLLILDGLDEVPEAAQQRTQVQEAVLDFRRQYPRVQILITSRTYAYQRQEWRLPDFAESVLAPFNQKQIQAFVDGWYAHIAQVRPSMSEIDAQARAARLKQAIEESEHLRDLAPRPLLLTLMASLHAWRGGTLPQAREQLYDESVELLLDIWQRPKLLLDSQGQPLAQDASVEEFFKLPIARFRRALEALAYAVHAGQPEITGTADIPEADLVQALRNATREPDLRPQRVVEYIEDRAGLLTHRGTGIYSFPHRTFQEYLAARYLTEHGFPGQLVQAVQADPERWREVTLLAGAKVARGTPYAGWSLASRLCPLPYEATSCQPIADNSWWTTLLAGQLLVETEIYRDPDPHDMITLQRIKAWLTALITHSHLPPVDRAQAGMVLGLLGDERPGVGLKDGLPDIDWITIEPGPFIMGSDEIDAAKPQYTCDLIRQPYAISRYPVTVAQYSAFVAAGGYEQRSFWTETGWAWREREQVNGPQKFDNLAFQIPNHPQVGVSWYEALAFCNWLSAETGFHITLPNEVEWERAARDTDGRRYPWGDKYGENHCNMKEAGIGHTSAVGIFPKGNAVCGTADMAGNVWEWTQSLWGANFSKLSFGYPYDPDDGREDLIVGNDMLRVMRGGSCIMSNKSAVQCAFRDRYFPNVRGIYSGFRCCRFLPL